MRFLRVPLLAWVGVGLVLVAGMGGGAVLAWWRWDTARQPQVHDDTPVMNRAVLDVLTATGTEASVAVSGMVRAAACSLGPLREGGIFTVGAELYTDPGSEEQLIDHIAARMPSTMRASRQPVPGAARSLTATIGHGVRLTVSQLGEGWVSANARTGCSLGAATAYGSPPPTSPGLASLSATLAALGTRPAAVTEYRLTCPAGQISTVAALSQPTDPSRLAPRITPTIPKGAHVFGATVNRVAYRLGPVSVLLAASDDGTAITIEHTTDC